MSKKHRQRKKELATAQAQVRIQDSAVARMETDAKRADEHISNLMRTIDRLHAEAAEANRLLNEGRGLLEAENLKARGTQHLLDSALVVADIRGRALELALARVRELEPSEAMESTFDGKDQDSPRPGRATEGLFFSGPARVYTDQGYMRADPRAHMNDRVEFEIGIPDYASKKAR